MRLFVAAWPDDATRSRLSALDLGPAKGIRLVGSTRWHVTLRFIGEVGDDEADVLGDALMAAVASIPGPRPCRVGPATAWFGRARVLQLPVAGLEEVADVVRAATEPLLPAGARDEPPFKGHLTLGRARGRRLGPAAQAELAGLAFDAVFEVTHVDLVRSEPSPEGHRYTTVTHAPLGRAHDPS